MINEKRRLKFKCVICITLVCVIIFIQNLNIAFAKNKWTGEYRVDLNEVYTATLSIKKQKNGKYKMVYNIPMGNNIANCIGKVKRGVLVGKGRDGEDYVKVKLKKKTKNKYKVTEIYYTDKTYSEIRITYDGNPAIYSLDIKKE